MAFTTGAESASVERRLRARNAIRLLTISLFISILAFITSFVIVTDERERWLLPKLYQAHLYVDLKIDRPIAWGEHLVPPAQFITAAQPGAVQVSAQIARLAVISAGGGGAVFLLLVVHYARRGRRERDTQTIRGTSVISARELQRETRNEGDLTIAGINIPRDVEPEHFLMAGSTGQGKSVAICELLAGIAKRDDRAVVVDYGGEMLSRFFNPERGDVILNPFDARTEKWSPFTEIETSFDCDALSNSIIPNGSGGDSAEWNRYAQTFIRALLARMHRIDDANLETFRRHVTATDTQILQHFLIGSAAAGLVASDAAKMFASIRGIASSKISAYEYLDSMGDFSIRQWMRRGAGWLFLTYREDQRRALQSLIATQLDVAITALLSMPAAANRRSWFILDEFDSIGAVNSIPDLVTKARKKGGVGVIAIQNVSQLRSPERYGLETTQTILGNLNNGLLLKTPDPDTADYISKWIGEREIERRTRNLSAGTRATTEALNSQITTQRAILPSEIQALPKLNGFLRLSGFPPAEVKLCPRDYPIVAESFVPAEVRSGRLADPQAPAAPSHSLFSGVASPTPDVDLDLPSDPPRTDPALPVDHSPEPY